MAQKKKKSKIGKINSTFNKIKNNKILKNK